MPILTFWGWTPSGASARAIFAFPKGKKGAFSVCEKPYAKVIHKRAAKRRGLRPEARDLVPPGWNVRQPGAVPRNCRYGAKWVVDAAAGYWDRLLAFSGSKDGGSRTFSLACEVIRRPAGVVPSTATSNSRGR